MLLIPASFAAGLARREHTSPGKIDADKLVRTLVEHRQLVSFFNDFKVDGQDASVPAVEYDETENKAAAMMQALGMVHAS